MLNAAFPAADLRGSTAAPVPLADWPLTAQLALLAGYVHALPADQLLMPAGGGGPLLSLLLGWLLHTGMRCVQKQPGIVCIVTDVRCGSEVLQRCTPAL